MIHLLALSALVAVASSVSSDAELPAAVFDPERQEWQHIALRRGRSNKIFAVQRSLNSTAQEKTGITIPVPAALNNFFTAIQNALTPPVAITTPITDFIGATVELSPTDLTLLICDQADANSCGQVDFPGAGSCSGILGVNICMCSLPSFILDMRTGKCKPLGSGGLVCTAGKTCTANGQCNNNAVGAALAGSSCTAPSATTQKCTCPANFQFNPFNCDCIPTGTECAKSRNLCNQIDLFAFCQTVPTAINALGFQCLCSFGFTAKKGSCVKDLGTLVALKKPKLYLAGKITGILGIVFGAIFIGLSIKKSSSCDILAEVRAYDEYKDTVNETFDRLARTFACDPDEFDVEDNELAAY